MSTFDITKLIYIFYKNIFYILLIIVLFNFYPVYLFLNHSFFSKVKVLSTEIAPVNEINLIPLRDFETKIANAKILIESGYTDLKIDKIQNPEDLKYTPQNMLSLFFDTAVSRESVKIFLNQNELKNIISERNFNVEYKTSNRIDPFTDKPQKTVIVNIEVPNLSYEQILGNFVQHINFQTLIKINEQLDISTSNLSNILENFKDIIETKKKEMLEERKIELQDELSLLDSRMAETTIEINLLVDDLKSNMNKNELNKFIEILSKFPSSGVLVNKDDLYNVNEEIKKYIASTYNLDETELRDIDVFSERGMFSNYIVNEIILKKNVKNFISLQKITFLVSSFNNMFFEQTSASNELEIIKTKIKNPSLYGVVSEFDENYVTQVSLIQKSLIKEKINLSKSLQVVNATYTDVAISNVKFNYWYFIVSIFLTIFVLSLFIILAYEFDQKKN